MNRHERITSAITAALSPNKLILDDDSAKHHGHAGAAPGGETHYTLSVESESFRGLSKVARHQLIYRILDAELKSGLHALAIRATAPGE